MANEIKDLDNFKNERHEKLRAEYLKRGFSNLGEAMNDHDFYYWQRRLRKTNNISSGK